MSPDRDPVAGAVLIVSVLLLAVAVVLLLVNGDPMPTTPIVIPVTR